MFRLRFKTNLSSFVVYLMAISVTLSPLLASSQNLKSADPEIDQDKGDLTVSIVQKYFQQMRPPKKLSFPFRACEKRTLPSSPEVQIYQAVIDKIYFKNQKIFKQLNIQRKNLCIEIVPDDHHLASVKNTPELHGIIFVRKGLFTQFAQSELLESVFAHELSHILLDSDFYVDTHAEPIKIQIINQEIVKFKKNYFGGQLSHKSQSEIKALYQIYQNNEKELTEYLNIKYLDHFRQTYEELSADFLSILLMKQIKPDYDFDNSFLSIQIPESSRSVCELSIILNSGIPMAGEGSYPTLCYRYLFFRSVLKIESPQLIEMFH